MDRTTPRLHELGGPYASGEYIGRRYSPGQLIDIEIELTQNHFGYFELRLCPLNGLQTEIQTCFDKYCHFHSFQHDPLI